MAHFFFLSSFVTRFFQNNKHPAKPCYRRLCGMPYCKEKTAGSRRRTSRCFCSEKGMPGMGWPSAGCGKTRQPHPVTLYAAPQPDPFFAALLEGIIPENRVRAMLMRISTTASADSNMPPEHGCPPTPQHHPLPLSAKKMLLASTRWLAYYFQKSPAWNSHMLSERTSTQKSVTMRVFFSCCSLLSLLFFFYYKQRKN